jgi:hypothetical protein
MGCSFLYGFIFCLCNSVLSSVLQDFINEFKEKCNECLLILIELEIEVTEWIKSSLDEKQT